MSFYVAKDDSRDYTPLREAFICHNAMMDIFERGQAFWRKCNARRGCYAKLCHDEKQVTVTTNNKGAVSVAPAASGGGSEEEVVNVTVPSLTSYCNLWKGHYPNLKVRKPTEDICNFCYKIYTGHKLRSSVPLIAAETEEAANLIMEELVLETEEDQVDFLQSVSAENGLNIPESLTELADSQEKELLEAAIHVKQALAMRSLANDKMEMAKRHRNEDVPHCDRVYTVVADFCQNMELPHFGSNQSGETYYLTPAKLEGFGVVDVSHSVEILGKSEHVHVWKIDPQNDWKNYGDFLRQPCITLAEAKLAIAKNHIFCSEWLEENGGEINFYTRQSALEEHKEAVGRTTNPKFARGGHRKELLKSMVPRTIKYKGLPGYKQILMSMKFKGYVPPENQNDPLYAVPPPEVLNAEAEDKKERRLAKKQKKESSTLTSANV
ncbi:hypothetical protein IV203_007796 [Nitzschia inconspicua]|uniref:Uncharacterized protein n=1 Tax=Nitzschia inconspicua TaxID=303405 RepID=A0A9K3PLJ3_9STRA|nr:hypothetical protein IV203_007796 [Nitzschia inconspicua]